MSILVFGLMSITLSTLINSLLVYIQKTKKILDLSFGKSANLVHGIIILPLWFVTFTGISELSLEKGTTDHQLLQILSILTFIAGTIIFYQTIVKLGWGSLVNINFFENKKTKFTNEGVFRYLNNPMYISFELYFVGLGLLTTSIEPLILAGYLFLALNMFQARIERP